MSNKKWLNKTVKKYRLVRNNNDILEEAQPRMLSYEQIKSINARVEQMALDYDLPLYQLAYEPADWQLELMKEMA